MPVHCNHLKRNCKLKCNEKELDIKSMPLSDGMLFVQQLFLKVVLKAAVAHLHKMRPSSDSLLLLAFQKIKTELTVGPHRQLEVNCNPCCQTEEVSCKKKKEGHGWIPVVIYMVPCDFPTLCIGRLFRNIKKVYHV